MALITTHPSGCGKSTLLRIFNRIYSLYPEQRAVGEVNLDGKNILAVSFDVNQLRARVGMVMQKPTPFPMSVYDNVAYGVSIPSPFVEPRVRRRTFRGSSGVPEETTAARVPCRLERERNADVRGPGESLDAPALRQDTNVASSLRVNWIERFFEGADKRHASVNLDGPHRSRSQGRQRNRSKARQSMSLRMKSLELG